MRTIEHWIGGKPAPGALAEAADVDAAVRQAAAARWPHAERPVAASYHFPTSV